MLEIVDLDRGLKKSKYRKKRNRLQTRMRHLGYELHRKGRPAILVFEGWDAAGKGGAIKRLVARMDPRFVLVHPISKPGGDDGQKHYLWRFWRRLPGPGQVAIFDRSWYGRVLVERVEALCEPPAWQRAYREIRDFEQQLVDSGAIVMKFWVHISRDEQLRRFEARRDDPKKRWKLTEEDWRNRDRWSDYEEAVEEMLIRTSTSQAPWTIVAGNDKRYARVQVLREVCGRLEHELHFDASESGLRSLPEQAAPVPVPKWALEAAAEQGLIDTEPADGTGERP